MSTIVEPSTYVHDNDGFVSPRCQIVHAEDLEKGMVVTNIGTIDAIGTNGVFVIAAIRGTVWSTASGKGDVHTLDVVWHSSQQVTIDTL